MRPDAAIPADYYELVYPEDREALREHAREARSSCAHYTLQYRVVWTDGSVHWLEGSGTSCAMTRASRSSWLEFA